jgi:hypothetical protein
MSEIIKFLAQDEHTWEIKSRPIPAAKQIPQWWKDIPAYSNFENKFDLSPAPTVTVKRCVPILDALVAGYYVPLWADCLIKQDNQFPQIKWVTNEKVFDVWNPDQVSSFEFKDGYSKTAFKYLHGWTIKTPPGWSCLITHPIAYQNLPFRTISGIVDTDIWDGEINVPIIIEENFEGILEKNTPMFQIIPFKRSTWDSEFELKKPQQHFFELEKFLTKITRGYHSLIKDKKIYR